MGRSAGDDEGEMAAEEGEEAAQKRIVEAVSKAGKRLQEEAEHKFAEEGTDVRVMRESAARAARGDEDGDNASAQGACSPWFAFRHSFARSLDCVV